MLGPSLRMKKKLRVPPRGISFQSIPIIGNINQLTVICMTHVECLLIRMKL